MQMSTKTNLIGQVKPKTYIKSPSEREATHTVNVLRLHYLNIIGDFCFPTYKNNTNWYYRSI